MGRGNTTSISDPSPLLLLLRSTSSPTPESLFRQKDHFPQLTTTVSAFALPVPPPAPPPFWMMDDQAKNLANFDRDGDSSGQGSHLAPGLQADPATVYYDEASTTPTTYTAGPISIGLQPRLLGLRSNRRYVLEFQISQRPLLFKLTPNNEPFSPPAPGS
ncbi:unnamed protein product [Parascedosporium putredinis]|uniref:Uncharacterized protein n=1 Tax=Parascedosporium putredinis TaxID=1442378 RepID=A0A9P1MB94_9PEZI|nr:unnamed protein product [Parascedosporium putredinis]CAI7995808.1 unnamed protein product [Parascedosporium putredinis]